MAQTLYEHYTSKGQSLPSLAERAKIASQYGINGYTGTASQNNALLGYLSGGGGSVLGANVDANGYGTNNGQNLQNNNGVEYLNGVPLRNDEQAIASGYYGQTEAQNLYNIQNANNPNYVPTLSPQESAQLSKEKGLMGLTDESYAGLTKEQAQAKADKKRKELLGAGTLGNDSSYYKVTQLDNIKKSVGDMTTGILKANNDSWNTPQDKTTLSKNLIDSTGRTIAQNYTDPQAFITDYQSNPSLQAVMADYIKAGGTIADVAKNISSNGANVAGDGTEAVTTNDYLSKILTKDTAGLGDSVYTASADKYMEPNREATIDEINRIARVPQQLTDLYYGTPEKLGIYEKIKNTATVAIDNLKKAYQNSENDSSSAFDLQVQINNNQGQVDMADMEKQRLQAKNLLTEKLASIGALTTTGEAPTALANLDQKYEQAKSQYAQKLQFENSSLMQKKTELVNKLRTDLEKEIQSIESDLTKSDSEIQKAVFDAQQKTQKEINTEIDQFNTKARSVYDKFLNVSNKSAQTYIANFLKTASGGLSAQYLKDYQAGIASTKKTTTKKTTSTSSKTYTPTEQKNLTRAGLSSNTPDVQSYFLNTKPAFQDEWNRNVALGQNKNPTIDNIHNSYVQWTADQKKKTGGRTL